MTEKQIPKLVATLVEHMSCFNALSTEDVDWVLKGKQKETIGVCVAAIKKHRLQKIFKPIFDDKLFFIEARDCRRNILNAKDVFKERIASEFADFGLDKPSEPTGRIVPRVYELKNNFQLSDFIWKNNKFFTQAQIVEFCEKYPICLSQVGATLFPLIEHDERYVVCNIDNYGVGVERFESNVVYAIKNCRRIVFPESLF